METIKFVDTTIRDGHQSLWAENMTTGMMHPVLRHMDRAGFDGMEFFVSGRFKKVVRENVIVDVNVVMPWRLVYLFSARIQECR